MIFTTGELIILAVVAIALIAFRQLDRGNRSLEKVRKYAEKSREELAAFVEERAAGIKDYSIELDVQQKAAKVLLERIQALEGSLDGRADAIGRIDARIAEYDKAMGELMDMTGRAQENLERLHEESKFVDGAARRVREAQEALVKTEDGIAALTARWRADAEAALSAHKDRLLGEVGARLDGVSAELSKTEDRIRQYENFAVEVEKRRERSVAGAMERLDADFEAAFARARTEAEKLEGLAFKKLKEGISERAQRLQEALEEKYQALQQGAKERIAETQGMLKAFRADWQREAAGLLEGARAEAASVTAALGDRLDALEARAGDFEGQHADRMERIEQKAEALAKGAAEKLGAKIEAMQARAAAGLEEGKAKQQALDALLSAAVQETRAKVAAFEKEVQEKVGAAQRQLKEAGAQLDAESKEIERRLAAFSGELSGKLSGAASRLELEVVGALEARLDGYRKEVDYRFKALDAVNVDVEQLDAGLRKSMAAIEERLRGDFDGFSRGLHEKQREGEQRLDADMAKIQSTLDEIERELAALKEKAYDNVSAKLKVFEDDFFKDIQDRSLAVNRRLEEWRKGLDGQLAALGAEAERARGELEQKHADQLGKRLADYGAKANAQLEKLGEQLAALKVGSHEALKQVAADFAAQKKALIEQTQEERKALKLELQENARRVEELSGEVDSRSKKALSDFAAAQAAAAQEARAVAAEIAQGAQSSLQAFRADSQEAREKFEAIVQRQQAKAEEEMRALSAELAEIDRRQKSYLAQTKLFERGDELKAQLTADIERLRADLGTVDDKRRELEALGAELAKVRRMEEETGAKVKEFLQERRRIEKMEEDFNRLIALSQSIDARLAQLSGSDEALEKAQLDMRKFLELSGEVEAKYERVEKKGAVIEATAQGVEKGFQSLQALERNFRQLEAEIKGMPKDLAALRADVDALHERREQVKFAVDKLGGLDALLSDIEKRADSMQKAREWLAKTETRLEEISRQAQDQVKLLEGLLKAEAKSGKGEKGAPPLSVREMVTKLARQGWSVEEIARATKLSRGEVELILEVGAK